MNVLYISTLGPQATVPLFGSFGAPADARQHPHITVALLVSPCGTARLSQRHALIWSVVIISVRRLPSNVRGGESVGRSAADRGMARFLAAGRELGPRWRLCLPLTEAGWRQGRRVWRMRRR